MIVDCAGKCGRRIIANADGRAYLCKPCWRKLFDVLLAVIRPAKEPHLRVAQTPTTEQKTVA